MYTGDDLTNFWELVALGVTIALAGTTISARFVKFTFFFIGVLFLLAGLCWGWVKQSVPAIVPFISQISLQPISWFILVMAMGLAIWLRRWRGELAGTIAGCSVEAGLARLPITSKRSQHTQKPISRPPHRWRLLLMKLRA